MAKAEVYPKEISKELADKARLMGGGSVIDGIVIALEAFDYAGPNIEWCKERDEKMIEHLPGQHVADSGAAEALLLRQQVAELKSSLDTALDHIGRLFSHLYDLPSKYQTVPVREDNRRAGAFLKSLVLPDLSARAQLVNASLKRGRGLAKDGQVNCQPR